MTASTRDPILADASEVRSLTGFSGASVVLMTRDGRTWFVRKAARTPEGSARLRGQLAKQLAFEATASQAVRTPRVLDQGEREGRFFFDMEFIRGTDGISYLRRASYPEVATLTERICAYLGEVRALPAHHAATVAPFEALYAKVCDVQRKTAALDGVTLSALLLALDRLRSVNLSPTLCHGDLTLENLVVDSEGTVWLLDFLDAPYEHWSQDVAKLHQDLEGGWYQLTKPAIARCVLEYLSSRVLAAATAMEPEYPQMHALLVCYAFVRILPYARTPEELAFVKHRIEHFARLTKELASV